MKLLIPNRKPPSKKSFPTSPEGVRAWLNRLQPISGADSIRQLYRGLKHSNRLDNTNHNRVEIGEILEPAIFEALNLLKEHYLDQSLPLPKKSRLSHQLTTEMLQELAFMHKIVVNDTYNTLLHEQKKARTTGIYKGLCTIAMLIESHIHIMSDLPESVIRDANVLYQLAASSTLNDAAYDDGVQSIDTRWTIERIYIYIQLLTLAAPNNQRRRQIPLLFKFLAMQAGDLKIQTADTGNNQSDTTYSIHLNQDSRPQLARYTQPMEDEDLCFLDIQPLINNLDAELSRVPESVSSVLEAEKLSKHTLLALKRSLQRSQTRKSARAITRIPVRAKTGLSEITASLRYSPADIQIDDSINHQNASDPANNLDCWPRIPINQDGSWIILNENQFGACLEWRDQTITETDVGELVAWHTDTAGSSDHAWMIGIIRWVSLQGNDRLLMGIEYFARNAFSVTLDFNAEDDTTTSRQCLITNDSLHSPDQHSLIAPPFVFRENDGVKTQEETRYQLVKKISATPACDFFTVKEVS